MNEDEDDEWVLLGPGPAGGSERLWSRRVPGGHVYAVTTDEMFGARTRAITFVPDAQPVAQEDA